MITISARVNNSKDNHQVTLETNGSGHSIVIPPKASGFGSSANGGELLFLALATCYCNDIYREAAKRNIVVRSVQVEVAGEFGDAPGSPAQNIMYKAVVEAEASSEDIINLMRHTDTVAEIQNSLRLATSVTLHSMEAVPV
jgi:uncharacterized OsmC-like protein